MANLGQRAISIVPTFVPIQQTDGHICAQASYMQESRLSRFVSAGTLKTGRLFSVARLPRERGRCLAAGGRQFKSGLAS
jgi:hypothetical protein